VIQPEVLFAIKGGSLQTQRIGATGRVYGTVYSGLDLGFALAAPIFGAVLDGGHPGGVFYGAALAMAFGVLSAGLIGLRVGAKARAVAV